MAISKFNLDSLWLMILCTYEETHVRFIPNIPTQSNTGLSYLLSKNNESFYGHMGIILNALQLHSQKVKPIYQRVMEVLQFRALLLGRNLVPEMGPCMSDVINDILPRLRPFLKDLSLADSNCLADIVKLRVCLRTVVGRGRHPVSIVQGVVYFADLFFV